jgi:hypothetical protein
LSAFFKLQEQNIVSLLNKRLQEHQEELKQIERMCDDQNSAAAQRISLDQEQDHEIDRRDKEKLKLVEIDPARIIEHDLATSLMQSRQQINGVSKRLEMANQGEGQDYSSPGVWKCGGGAT